MQFSMRFSICCLFLCLVGSSATAVQVSAKEALSAQDLARAMHTREEGQYLEQKLTMTLVSKGGRSRTRVADYRRSSNPESRRTLICFTEPQRIRGSSFLTHEHKIVSKADDQWLYLPALRRIRRVAAADRGDFFFGSDLTYEDVKDATKFDLQDYQFQLLSDPENPPLGEPKQNLSESNISVLEAIPTTAKIAKELGYGRVVAWVDQTRFVPLRVHYWNTKGELIKRVLISQLAEIDGIWTPLKVEAYHATNGHRSIFEFTDVKHPAIIAAEKFDHTQLAIAR